MIFNNKIELARYLDCSRPKIDRMIEKWEIKKLTKLNTKDELKTVWYVIVLEFIHYLSK